MCWFYAIGTGLPGSPIKFGNTNNLKSRLKDLNTGNCMDQPYTVLFAIKCPNKTAAQIAESLAHTALSAHQVRSEWFRIDLKLAEYIIRGAVNKAAEIPEQLSFAV